MTLCTFDHAEAAVKVSTVGDEPDHLFCVEGVESTEQGEDRDRTEGETDRVFAPLVSGERASFRILERQHVCGSFVKDQPPPPLRKSSRCKDPRTIDNLFAVESVERILHGEDLDGAEGGVDVWVVIRIRREGAYRGPDRRKSLGKRFVVFTPVSTKERKKSTRRPKVCSRT